MKFYLKIFLATFLVLGACVKPVKKPTPPPIPPKFDKTFGNIHFDGGASLFIQYKSINLLIDPAGSSSYPSVDYLLLTDTQAHHWGGAAKKNLRKNLKTIVAPGLGNAVKKEGFKSVKEMGSGRKILLKKKEDFLFVATHSFGQDGQKTNGYLLEFDNGRNIFIGGEISNPDLVRPFVYNLRDEGKELHMAFVYGKNKAGGCDEKTCSDILALLQPKHGFVLQTQKKKPSFQWDVLNEGLKEALFYGEVYAPKKGQNIGF